MTQHTLGSEDDQRGAPLAHRLAPQQMEVLPCRRRLSDLHVIAGAELQEALDAATSVLRPLALVAVRQKHDEASEQIPFVFSGNDELIDDDLRTIGEVAELRFPHHQGFGEVT